MAASAGEARTAVLTMPAPTPQEIHNKVVSLGFQDCKVYVSNVDSQSSASGGIIIQVLGEMSNKSGPWRKFAQTFFLAEQPQGYFVLNDIFRYLKDEEETEEQAEEIDEDVRQDEQEARENNADVKGVKVDVSAIAQPDATPHVQPVITGSNKEEAVAAIGAPVEEQQQQEQKEAADGAAPDEQPVAVAAPAEAVAPAIEAAPAEAAKQETVQEATAAAAEQKAPVAAEDKAAPVAAPVSAPAPSAAAVAEPAKPKTWANLAASNATTWGNAVRSDARGVSSAAPPAASAAAAPTTSSSRPSSSSASQQRTNNAASVFIKSAQPDHVSESTLRTALSQFGQLKEVSLIPNRGCAFAEFTSVDAAKKAIAASAAQNGLPVGPKAWRVSVEEKRKPVAGGGAGGAQKSGGAQGAAGGNARAGGANARPARGGKA